MALMSDPPTAPTLQTVLDGLARGQGPSVKARADMESAIHVLCREASRQPAEVPVSQVEGLGKALNAARMGVTQRRVTNIRSMVRRAISLSSNEVPKRRLDFSLGPIWAELAALVSDRGDRILLERLFRILQLKGIEPTALGPAAFQLVRDYLHETGASRPDAIYRRIVLAWNRLNALLRSYRT
jgi:hypothetical protein